MKLALMVIVAFAASLAGTAGFVAFTSDGPKDTLEQEPAALADADSTAGNSQTQPIGSGSSPESREAVSHDSVDLTTEHDTTAATTEHSQESDSPPGPDLDAIQTTSVTPPAPAGVQSGTSPTASMAVASDELEQQRQAYRQVARILSNMRERDVAQILAHIQDEDVEGILRQLTARDAAKLLSELPAERAAQLSKRLLRTAPQAGGTR